MKAGKSSETAVVLPSVSTKSLARAKVTSSVAMPRIISTSSITGTGFMKCSPMKRSGRSVAAASLVMEMDDVLVATMASALRNGQSATKILRFTVSSSVAASITIGVGEALKILGIADAGERLLAILLGN